jgi:hypothetical protein
MTPAERAVIRAAERVSCTADLPESRFHADAFAELDRAVAAHDRVAADGWWNLKDDEDGHSLLAAIGLWVVGIVIGWLARGAA